MPPRLAVSVPPLWDRDTPLITANRLYMDVLRTGDIETQAKSQTAWEPRTVLTAEAWLRAQWTELHYAKPQVETLLSVGQEQLLWRSLFEREFPNLFDAASAARAASKAARAIAEWRIPQDSSMWEDSADASHFRSLLDRFEVECRRRNCITSFQLWTEPTIRSRAKGAYFIGWEQPPTLLRETGGRFSPLELPNRSRPVPAAEHESFGAQVEWAARRARELIKRDPGECVGILITDLQGRREQVGNVFEQVFYPGGTDTPLAFHVHSSTSLLGEACVAAATLLLQIAQPSIALGDASAILRSPYLKGAAEEKDLRALADVQLRRNREFRVTRGDVAYCSRSCSLLQPIWQAIDRYVYELPRVAPLDQWSDYFSAILGLLGWPNAYEEASNREVDAIERWGKALSELAQLSFVSFGVPFTVALRELHSILQHQEAPLGSSGLFAPVQIMDATDAFALRFDRAIVVDLSEDQWPYAEESHPFLPARLRRSVGMPRAGVAEIARARARQTADLLASAPDVFVTYSVTPSPLARPYLESAARSARVWRGLLPVSSFPPTELEYIEDEFAPPLASGAQPSGGISIIKAQSACPFQAFALYRLQARSPEEGCFGLDARERGNTLHKALQNVWRTLADSERLRSLSAEALQQTIFEAVEEAVSQPVAGSFQEMVREAEKQRLRDLLEEWLAFEKSRSLPFTVEQTEREVVTEMSGLPLRLRIDRVDRLPDGTVVLIDYKSSKAIKLDDLGSERPREPQLLLYATAIDERVDGVYIAKVRAREMRAFGYADRAHFPERSRMPRPSWSDQSDAALERLQAIAAEFTSGVAAVDPQRGACDYCGVKPLCRVREAAAGEDDDGGEE